MDEHRAAVRDARINNLGTFGMQQQRITHFSSTEAPQSSTSTASKTPRFEGKMGQAHGVVRGDPELTRYHMILRHAQRLSWMLSLSTIEAVAGESNIRKNRTMHHSRKWTRHVFLSALQSAINS